MELQRIVMDTDVLIYAERKSLLEDVLLNYEVAITFVTLYEYLRGLRRIGKDEETLRKVKEELEETFAVLWPSNETLLIASRIWDELRKRGTLIDERDLLIGALCIERGIPLWTFNVKHFDRLREFGLVLHEPKLKGVDGL